MRVSEWFAPAGLLFRGKEELYTDVGDPTGLAAPRGDFLKAAATHQQEKNGLLAVEGVPTSDAERGFALFGCPVDTISILLIVNF